MKDAFGVDVVNCFQQLVHVDLHLSKLEVLISDQTFVKVLLHKFED